MLRIPAWHVFTRILSNVFHIFFLKEKLNTSRWFVQKEIANRCNWKKEASRSIIHTWPARKLHRLISVSLPFYKRESYKSRSLPFRMLLRIQILSSESTMEKCLKRDHRESNYTERFVSLLKGKPFSAKWTWHESFCNNSPLKDYDLNWKRIWKK